MGVQQNVGTVTANITGNINVGLPTGATQIVIAGVKAGAGSTTLYTVTAGKTLYIVSCWVSGIDTAAEMGTGKITADIGGAVALLKGDVNGLVSGGSPMALATSFPVPVQVAATKTVVVTTTGASMTTEAGFTGYEL